MIWVTIVPGQRAAAERDALFPLVDAGFTKAMVRDPSGPSVCALGQARRRLPRVTRPLRHDGVGERAVSGSSGPRLRCAGSGLRDLRVRHYDDIARIEVPLVDLAAVVSVRTESSTGVRCRLPLRHARPRGPSLGQPQPGPLRLSSRSGGRLGVAPALRWAASSPDGHDHGTGPALGHQGARPHPPLPRWLLHRAAGRPRCRRGEGRGPGRRRRAALRRAGRRAGRPHLPTGKRSLRLDLKHERAPEVLSGASPPASTWSWSRCARACSTPRGWASTPCGPTTRPGVVLDHRLRLRLPARRRSRPRHHLPRCVRCSPCSATTARGRRCPTP